VSIVQGHFLTPLNDSIREHLRRCRDADGWWWLAQAQTRNYIMHAFPYWNRTSGRDHLWVLTDGESVCELSFGGNINASA
jgi:hypothetical protein